MEFKMIHEYYSWSSPHPDKLSSVQSIENRQSNCPKSNKKKLEKPAKSYSNHIFPKFKRSNVQ